MPAPSIVVIGASAGGVEAVSAVVSKLPPGLNSAVFVVMHIPAHTPSQLGGILGRVSPLKVMSAVDGHAIEPGHVYVASADRHLMVEEDRMRLTYGPREGRMRPSIDVLFRSAAAAFGPRVVGVVLTGLLDDGTAGLWTIKDRGGRALVQDPATARFPSMPENAIDHVEVDAVLPLEALAGAIARMTDESVGGTSHGPISEHLRIENLIAREGNGLRAGVMRLGDMSPYTCPDCHGVMVRIRQGSIVRFRCHTGHSYSLRTLITETDLSVHARLWETVKVLEERVMLLRQMADQARNPGIAGHYSALADSTEQHMMPLRELALDPRLVGEPVEDRVTTADALVESGLPDQASMRAAHDRHARAASAQSPDDRRGP